MRTPRGWNHPDTPGIPTFVQRLYCQCHPQLTRTPNPTTDNALNNRMLTSRELAFRNNQKQMQGDPDPASVPAEAAGAQQVAAAPTARRVLWVGKCVSIRRRNLVALLQQEKAELFAKVGPPSLPPHLSRAAFKTDVTLLRQAALVLAKSKHYIAAKNYLLLSLARSPLSDTAEADCSSAVMKSLSLSSRRLPETSYKWSDFPSDGKGCLRIAHHVLIGSSGKPPESADELKTWVHLLLASPDLFGGPSSHLILALAELVRATLGDFSRFEPPAKVFANDEKSGRWTSGAVMPPEDEITKKADKAGGPAMAATKTAAPAGASPGAPLARPTKEAEGATIRVRLKAVAGLPPRTAILKQSQVLNDVEAGTSRVFVPGLMLLEAAALGRKEVVLALLDQGGVCITEADEEVNTALMHAAFNCTTPAHREVCRLLVERHCDPEANNHYGTSAYDVALTRRDPALRRIFRPSESDKDFTRAARTSFAIHSAIDAGDDDLALSELGSPGNTEAAKVHRVTPLMMAARMGSSRVTQALLDRGASADKKSEHGCTAIYVAAEEGHVSVLEALLASELPPERMFAPDIHETTPLMRASENGHSKAVSLLLRFYSRKQCNAVSQKGWTALLLAAYNGYAAVVKQLLAHGASADVGKKVGQKVSYTPLCYACMTGRLDCVTLLLASETSTEKQLAPIALKLAQDHENHQCVEALRNAGVCEGDDGKANDGPKDEGLKKGQRGAKDAAEQARSGVAAANATSIKAQFLELQEREKALLRQLQTFKQQQDALKTRMRKLRQRMPKEGSGHDPAMKPLWAFSPSGRWNLNGTLTASDKERGGAITCEYGEPAQTVFVPQADPVAEVSA